MIRTGKLLLYLLLAIPGVNWIYEILRRFLVLIRRFDGFSLLEFLIALPFGLILGYVDLAFLILFKRFFTFRNLPKRK